MRTTYTIARGHQYNRNGFRITADRYAMLMGFGEVGMRGDGTTGLVWEGTLHVTDPAASAAVEPVILAVMADGETRTVTVGEDEPVKVEGPAWVSARGLTLADEMSRDDTTY